MQQSQRLQDAEAILEDYKRKDATVDIGNLFFAAMEYKEAYEQAKTELNILKNPSDGRCMEIAALRESRKELLFEISHLHTVLEWAAQDLQKWEGERSMSDVLFAITQVLTIAKQKGAHNAP